MPRFGQSIEISKLFQGYSFHKKNLSKILVNSSLSYVSGVVNFTVSAGCESKCCEAVHWLGPALFKS